MATNPLGSEGWCCGIWGGGSRGVNGGFESQSDQDPSARNYGECLLSFIDAKIPRCDRLRIPPETIFADQRQTSEKFSRPKVRCRVRNSHNQDWYFRCWITYSNRVSTTEMAMEAKPTAVMSSFDDDLVAASDMNGIKHQDLNPTPIPITLIQGCIPKYLKEVSLCPWLLNIVLQ